MLSNSMTVDKRKTTRKQNKKQSITARTDRRFQQFRGVAIDVCMHLNFQCDSIEGVPGILGKKGEISWGTRRQEPVLGNVETKKLL